MRPPLTIRHRHRRGYVREAQGYTAWEEWQLVEGRKVIGRYDLKEQAERAREKRDHERWAAPMLARKIKPEEVK